MHPSFQRNISTDCKDSEIKTWQMGETTVCQQQQQHRPRGKRVALQESWSPAVGQRCARCVCVRACAAHLPPPPSARGRKSTFSLDPWRRLNTKLHREKDEVQRWDVTPLSPHHRCPAPQTRWPPHPPLPGRTRRTPLPRLRGAQRGGDQRGVSDGRRWGCHSAERSRRRPRSAVVWWGCFTLCFRGEGWSCAWCHAPPAPKLLVRERCRRFDWPELPATAAQRPPPPGCLSLSLTHTHTHTHCWFINYSKDRNTCLLC